MTAAGDSARAYASEHADRFLSELIELLRIPSLSGDPAHKDDIVACANWLAAHLIAIGAENVQIMPTAGHPAVFGEYTGAGPEKPTVLVYGHYDVVPASREDGWSTDPFHPVVKDGKVWARGATDDKGQLFIHVKAFESFLKAAGGSPVNLKFLLEGEEEVSSPNLLPLLLDHKDLFAADACVISDSSMPSIDRPAVLHSLRGMTYIEVHVEGPHDDLHSGFYGGAVHNPALALSQIIAGLFNPDNSIAVPGFYDDVVALTDGERAEIAKWAMTEQELLTATGVPAQWGDQTWTITERVSARPTLEVNGFGSGWTGPGPKTIIPAKAMAKISCRLVGNQNPQRIYELLKAHIEGTASPTVKVSVNLITTGDPALIDFHIPAMQAALRAYETAWGHRPNFTRGGGSIPIVADIYNKLNIPVVMMGYGLDTDGLHGTNEHYSIEMFNRGIATAIAYLDEFAATKQI
jgi:acetylornithine deacetylase/succinyl-diaminopimelate desuccinylase-like protein